jgi:hypothetical protein
MGIGDFFRNLFSKSEHVDRVAAYVIREHSRGRALAEIMEDHYVQNRLTPQAQRRLLDRPEVIHAIGQGEREAAQAQVESGA